MTCEDLRIPYSCILSSQVFSRILRTYSRVVPRNNPCSTTEYHGDGLLRTSAEFLRSFPRIHKESGLPGGTHGANASIYIPSGPHEKQFRSPWIR